MTPNVPLGKESVPFFCFYLALCSLLSALCSLGLVRRFPLPTQLIGLSVLLSLLLWKAIALSLSLALSDSLHAIPCSLFFQVCNHVLSQDPGGCVQICRWNGRLSFCPDTQEMQNTTFVMLGLVDRS